MITFKRLGSFGRLGNQLFQVALLLGVQAMRGHTAAILKRGIATDLPPEGASPDQKEARPVIELGPLAVSDMLPGLPGDWKPRLTYEEKSFAFDPTVFLQSDDVNFQGYFQTEKYFEHCPEIIRKAFTFKPEIDLPARAYMAGLRSLRPGPWVSVHVRRGDYLKNPHLFTVVSADWCKAAMQWMRPQAGQPTQMAGPPQFLVFSDDIPWCREHLSGGDVTFCTGHSHWQDMATMSLCDHHIISAGTFAWWGAWLNPNPNKMVLAPSPWFQPAMKADIKDILPAGWFTLPETAKVG